MKSLLPAIFNFGSCLSARETLEAEAEEDVASLAIFG